MRLFIALNLPADVREAIHEGAAPLRAAVSRGVGWVRPDALHLTLKFLGEVEEARAATVADALRTVAGRHAAMRVTVRGFGAFPSTSRPRVLWAGVEAMPRLELLHHDVEAACLALGFEVEGRAFRPHVTIGRVRPDVPRDAVRALAQVVADASLTGEAHVPRLDLMASTLMPGGARHEAVARLPFREG